MSDTYSEPVGEAWKYNQDYHRAADFLGVDKHDRDNFELANKISLIHDYAGMEAGSARTEDALNHMQAMRKKLGVNTQGKTLVNQLYQHVRLEMDRRRSGKPQAKSKPTPKKTMSSKNPLAKAIQSSVQNMVKEAISDKKFIEDTVKRVLR